jgi:Flp pilus assembly protein TadD
MTKIMKLSVPAIIVVLGWVILQAASANMGAEEANESIDPDYVAGKKAVESQDWKKAIELLSKAMRTVSNNSEAHNLLGYAYRKSGNYDASFAQYDQALKLDPSNKHAHEYIGEAYLLTGNLAKAEQHLTELQRLCSPIPCEEYRELKRAVDDYKKTKK